MNYKLRLYAGAPLDFDATSASPSYDYSITLDQVDAYVDRFIKGGWKLHQMRLVRIEEIPVRLCEGEKTLVVPTYFAEDAA